MKLEEMPKELRGQTTMLCVGSDETERLRNGMDVILDALKKEKQDSATDDNNSLAQAITQASFLLDKLEPELDFEQLRADYDKLHDLILGAILERVPVPQSLSSTSVPVAPTEYSEDKVFADNRTFAMNVDSYSGKRKYAPNAPRISAESVKRVSTMFAQN